MSLLSRGYRAYKNLMLQLFCNFPVS